jgi:glyoxylase-like metal-dependent hydrolase (beta-lactamase superfamily II)
MKRLGLGKPVLHWITPRVLAITGLFHAAGEAFGVNAGIIFTENSTIFIDCGMTIAAGEFLWQTTYEQTGGDGDFYLTLTHHHSDHVFGMQALRDKGARVIAHEGVQKFLKDDNGQYKRFIMESYGLEGPQGEVILGEVALSLPDQIIKEDTTLKFDEEALHLLVTPGHVPDALCVYHPASGTIFAGDTNYEGMTSNTRFWGKNEWRIWVAQLERLKTLNIKVICPGHGKLCHKDEIDRNIPFLRSLYV